MPQFIGGGVRTKSYKLQWPIAFGGKDYHEIVLRRITTKELDDYIRDVQDAPPGVSILSPFMTDAAGGSLPLAVQDGLDADDGQNIGQMIRDFTPARYRGAPAENASAPGTSDIGGNTSVE